MNREKNLKEALSKISWDKVDAKRLVAIADLFAKYGRLKFCSFLAQLDMSGHIKILREKFIELEWDYMTLTEAQLEEIHNHLFAQYLYIVVKTNVDEAKVVFTSFNESDVRKYVDENPLPKKWEHYEHSCIPLGVEIDLTLPRVEG